jgi:hypothetical protein
MPAGTIDSCIGDRASAEDESIFLRERIHARRIFFHKEIGAESLSPQIGFIHRIRDCFFLKGFCFEIDPQNFIKEAFHLVCLSVMND